MTTIRPLPELRALAEAEARETWDAVARLWDGAMVPPMTRWAYLDGQIREMHTAAHVALLLDVSRPASRDAVVRLVAEKVGLEPAAVAPGFWFFIDPEGGQGWILETRPQHVNGWDWADTYKGERDTPRYGVFFGDDETMDDAGESTPGVPNVSSTYDPAAALALICAALWPSPTPGAAR